MSTYIYFSARIVTLSILVLNLIGLDMFRNYLTIWDKGVSIFMTATLSIFAIVGGAGMNKIWMRGAMVFLGVLTVVCIAYKLVVESKANHIPEVMMNTLILLCFVIMIIEIIIKNRMRKCLFEGP